MNHRFQQRVDASRNTALLAGAIGLAACAAGAARNAQQFFISYLAGWLFWIGLALGCFTIAMIHYLTGGRWGYPIRRFLEAGFSTLPLMLLLFIPILFGLRELYPWARTEEVAREHVLGKRLPYMTPAWFIARALFCLLLWSAMAWLLRRWSLKQDDGTDALPWHRLRKLSGAGVLLFPLTATFAYVDWIVSLEKEWYSSIFGIIVLAGQVLSAIAFVTVLLRLFQAEETVAATTNRVVYHQLGNLLLTFVLFWTYLSFGQLLIIYSANLPQEIAWYRHRIAGSWKIVIAIIVLLHFALPFLLLLFRALKRSASALAAVAVMLLMAHFVAVYWLIAPAFHQNGPMVSWLDLAAAIGVGGLWIAAFLWLLARAPLLPRNDPRMKEEFAHAAP